MFSLPSTTISSLNPIGCELEGMPKQHAILLKPFVQRLSHKFINLHERFNQQYLLLSSVQKWIWRHRCSHGILHTASVLLLKIFPWLCKSFTRIEQVHFAIHDLQLHYDHLIATLALQPPHVHALFLALQIVKTHGKFLEFLDCEYKNNPLVIHEALIQLGWQAGSDNTTSYKALLEVVKHQGMSLRYASANLRKNKILVMKAIKNNPLAYTLADKSLAHDLGVARCVVSHRGVMLQHLPPKLCSNPEIALIAVKQDGLALQFVERVLLSQEGIVCAALLQNGLAMEFAPEWIKKSKKHALMAIANQPDAMAFVDLSLREDLDLALAAIQKDPLAIRWFNPSVLLHHPEIARLAVKSSYLAYFFLPNQLKKSKELALAAVQGDYMAIYFLDQQFLDDPDIIFATVQKNGLMLACASPCLRANKSIAITAVMQNPSAINFVADELQGDLEFLPFVL